MINDQYIQKNPMRECDATGNKVRNKRSSRRSQRGCCHCARYPCIWVVVTFSTLVGHPHSGFVEMSSSPWKGSGMASSGPEQIRSFEQSG